LKYNYEPKILDSYLKSQQLQISKTQIKVMRKLHIINITVCVCVCVCVCVSACVRVEVVRIKQKRGTNTVSCPHRILIKKFHWHAKIVYWLCWAIVVV